MSRIVEERTVSCPCCGSDEIESGHAQTDDGSCVWFDSECSACHASWQEIYSFDYIEVWDEGNSSKGRK